MASSEWEEKNRKYLVDCISVIKRLLRQHVAKIEEKNQDLNSEEMAQVSFPSRGIGDDLPAIEKISRAFSLSEFETSILLLCAAVELDSEVSYLCARAQDNSNSVYPTFGLTMQIFSNPHWSAISPMSNLRRFKLIDTYGFPQILLAKSPLYIEERVLHYLTGVSYLEKQLQELLRPISIKIPLVRSHENIVNQVLSTWKNTKENNLPVVQLLGNDPKNKINIAREVCSKMDLGLYEISAEMIPSKQEDLDSLIRLWEREYRLADFGLYVSIDALDSTMVAQKSATRRFINSITGPTFVGTDGTLSSLDRISLALEIKKPTKQEQLKLWQAFLGKKILNPKLEDVISKVVNQFDLDTSSIQAAVQQALLTSKGSKEDTVQSAIWHSSRSIARKDMAELAQRIEPKATMEDLILPAREKELLGEMLVHLMQKNTVYEKWGFGDKSGSRGLGIMALFAGESGTGKTMAAEVLANELQLDLFRIDLSMVVNKYIGETEKNLRKVFDAAEDGGGILFFDEADALFGKRSEVHDSHDRYANIEVGYLLQRMESYRGVAILATNMKTSIDQAFVRRIRFIVNFPFPDERSRAEMWKKVFPKSAPVDDLDIQRLSKLSITGGSIRNIALNASFLAASQNVPVSMDHLKRCAKIEYAKMERPLTSNEFGGWI